MINILCISIMKVYNIDLNTKYSFPNYLRFIFKKFPNCPTNIYPFFEKILENRLLEMEQFNIVYIFHSIFIK